MLPPDMSDIKQKKKKTDVLWQLALRAAQAGHAAL